MYDYVKLMGNPIVHLSIPSSANNRKMTVQLSPGSQLVRPFNTMSGVDGQIPVQSRNPILMPFTFITQD